jgi:exopolyphosphatase/guanosine-5'-triphosphate,3'-diphosphate pyrophosphatase
VSYAAIDCGTNSTRLLVHDGTRTVERLMRITRLGQGVDATGRLAPEAIERTLAVLREYRAVLDRHGVTKTRMTATSAARDAANRDEFFVPAREIVGVDAELLSGDEEGRLSFMGATADLSPDDGPFLVVDIGGGSTEFSYGRAECEYARSVDIGCVRLTEKYISHDPPRPEELVACLSLVETYVDDVVRDFPALSDAPCFVGLAGTVSTVASVEQGLAEYDRDRVHHFELTRAAVEDVFRTLATENRADRLGNPGLEAGRADVIVGGLCILVQIMRQLDLDRCLVSESDILDGLVMSLQKQGPSGPQQSGM